MSADLIWFFHSTVYWFNYLVLMGFTIYKTIRRSKSK